MITKAERTFIEKAIEGKSPLQQKEMAEQLIDYFTRKKTQPRQRQDFTPIDWNELLPALIGRDFDDPKTIARMQQRNKRHLG